MPGNTGSVPDAEGVLTNRALDPLIITNTDWNPGSVVNRVNRDEGHCSLQRHPTVNAFHVCLMTLQSLSRQEVM
ncbi:hypothetical protein GCM10009067_39440 [Haloarcula sebkhae]|uniref:Uncharacterized protein n=1 Tax=Haloarcula sebkhae TaxID=932660 RepID=A0A830ERN9_9EURY|nr:hypothetical protein GCM10009067_39440 [Haloarcula sebkhae]